MSFPSIFIGMPVYNGAEYIADAIESVLNQTYHDFSLTIYDNASTDGTLEIIKGFASQDPRISYIVHPSNLGAAENFWSVAKANHSEYFLWFSCDDLMEPEFLEECIGMLIMNPEFGMASTGFLNFDNDSKIYFEIPIPTEFFGKVNSYKIFKYLSVSEALGKANLIHSLFRRRVISDLLENYQFTLHSAWGGDMNLVLAALILGGGSLSSKKVLFKKRLPEGSSVRPHRNFLHRYVDNSFPTEFFFEYANTVIRVLRLTGTSRLLAIKIYLRFLIAMSIKEMFFTKDRVIHYYYYYLSKLQKLFSLSYSYIKVCFAASEYKMYINARVILSKTKQFLLTLLKK